MQKNGKYKNCKMVLVFLEQKIYYRKNFKIKKIKPQSILKLLCVHPLKMLRHVFFCLHRKIKKIHIIELISTNNLPQVDIISFGYCFCS